MAACYWLFESNVCLSVVCSLENITVFCCILTCTMYDYFATIYVVCYTVSVSLQANTYKWREEQAGEVWTPPETWSCFARYAGRPICSLRFMLPERTIKHVLKPPKLNSVLQLFCKRCPSEAYSCCCLSFHPLGLLKIAALEVFSKSLQSISVRVKIIL